MKCRKWELFTVMILIAAVLCAATYAKKCEKKDSDSLTASRSEHSRDGGEGRGEHERGGEAKHGEESEESGTQYALNQTYNKVRNGARLILAYDAKSNAFKGTVENTTGKTLKQVRVEVHLSNGTELGPTTPADLGPGEKRSIKLKATSRKFEKWSAHPEVGIGEHGSGEERTESAREAQSQHERQVTESQVPAKALAALKKLAAGAKFTGFAEEVEHGSTFYEGSWKTPAGANMDVLVTPAGALVEIEKQIDAGKVPAAVLKVVRKAAGKDTELMFEKKTTIQYEVKFGKDELGREMLLTPDGRLVEQEVGKGNPDDAGAGKKKCGHKSKKSTADYKKKLEHKSKKGTGDDKEKCEYKSQKSTDADKEKYEHKSKKDSNDDDDDDDKEKCEHKSGKGTGDDKEKCEHKSKKSTGDDDK